MYTNVIRAHAPVDFAAYAQHCTYRAVQLYTAHILFYLNIILKLYIGGKVQNI